MTDFIRANFEIHGGYAHYEGKFVARFKYARGIRGFCSFLAKNFTVEEFFGRIEAGESPLTILESKGYLLPHIKRWLKAANLPLNQEGFEELIRREVERRP